MRHKLIRLMLVLLPSMLVIGTVGYCFDYPIAQAAKHGQLHDLLPGDLRGFIRSSEAFAQGLMVLVLIALATRIDPRGLRIAPFLAASSLGAGLIADVIKLLVARVRPSKHDLEGVAVDSFQGWIPGVGGYDIQSFPSAHSAVAFGFAFALSRLYPRATMFFWLFAALAGFQRIESNAHYLSDVMIGASIGCLVANCAMCLLPSEQPLGQSTQWAFAGDRRNHKPNRENQAPGKQINVPVASLSN